MGRKSDAAPPCPYIPRVPSALYSHDILRLAASIPHLAPLERADARVEKRAPLCGSRVAVAVTLDSSGRIAAFGQEVKACALGQASAALMGAHVVGRTATELDEARHHLAAYLAGTREEPGAWPGLAVFAHARAYPARHGAILLPFEAGAEAAVAAAQSRAA
jgi:NifU-like protein involved in Fe-S cluster formation